MMGKALTSVEVPICKGTNSVTIISDDEARRKEPQPCIRCAKCVGACPMGLEPYLLAKISEVKNWERASVRILSAVLSVARVSSPVLPTVRCSTTSVKVNQQSWVLSVPVMLKSKHRYGKINSIIIATRTRNRYRRAQHVWRYHCPAASVARIVLLLRSRFRCRTVYECGCLRLAGVGHQKFMLKNPRNTVLDGSAVSLVCCSVLTCRRTCRYGLSLLAPYSLSALPRCLSADWEIICLTPHSSAVLPCW